MDVKDMAFVAGLVLGCLIIVSVCWVWVRRQVLGMGGGLLSFFGVVLVGLSVWSSASVEVSADGFRAEFEQLEKQVESVALRSQKISDEVRVVADANMAMSREIKVAAENIDVNKAQFLQLTSALQDKRVFSGAQTRSISDPIRNAPVIDKRALEVRIQRLDNR